MSRTALSVQTGTHTDCNCTRNAASRIYVQRYSLYVHNGHCMNKQKIDVLSMVVGVQQLAQYAPAESRRANNYDHL